MTTYQAFENQLDAALNKRDFDEVEFVLTSATPENKFEETYDARVLEREALAAELEAIQEKGFK